MARQFVGSSGDMASIIIDYKKKKVSMLRPDTGKPFKTGFFNFAPGDFIIAGALEFFLLLAVLPGEIFTSNTALKYGLLFFILLGLTLGAKKLFPNIFNYIHYLGQKWTTEYSLDRRLVIVTEMKSKIYQLPYKFGNHKLDYRCYGDFKKYLIKVHILPKDYYNVHGKSRTKQTTDWDAFFYFTKIPKVGRMEIDFV